MTCRWPSFPCAFSWSSLCIHICVLPSYSYKIISHSGLRPPWWPHFKLGHHFRDPFPTMVIFRESGVQDFNIWIIFGGGDTSHPITDALKGSCIPMVWRDGLGLSTNYFKSCILSLAWTLMDLVNFFSFSKSVFSGVCMYVSQRERNG